MRTRHPNVTSLDQLDHQRANFVIEYSKDFDARRAATASGFAADTGYRLRDEYDIQIALSDIIQGRLEQSHIDAEWVLWEAVDNHHLARQSNNINASNAALNMIAKFASVDAFAAEKIQLAGDEAIRERLTRARRRRQESCQVDDESDEPTFL